MGLPLTDLQGDRRLRVIARLLKPLRTAPHFYDLCNRVSGARDGIVLSSVDELDRSKPYRERKLKSNLHQSIYFQYFEKWRPEPGTGIFVPTQTYLHLYVARDPEAEPIEIACVHADPDEKPNDPMDTTECRRCDHKRGPHVHISASEPPLPHCHLPLNLSQLDDVLKSVETLTKAMEDAIQIISHEIREAYRHKS
jgi:hypothetical protein